MLENRLELIGSSGKIKEAVAAGTMVFVDFIEAFSQCLVTRFVFELALMIKNRLRKVFPDFIAYRLSRKVARGLLKIAPEFFIAFFAASKADDFHSWRQVAIGREVI